VSNEHHAIAKAGGGHFVIVDDCITATTADF